MTLDRRCTAALLLTLGLCLRPAAAQPPVEDTMTLEQQVAQMFMVTIHGAQLPETGRDFLQRWQPGALVLFNSNIGTPQAITQLTNSYQQTIITAGGPPLLIATDQEGGRVQRLVDGFTILPVPALMTAANDPELTRAMGRAVAEELRAVGINMSLAPVADLETNPDNPIIQRRTFGSDPKIAGRTIAAYVQGLHEGGVLATLKHFPGHGDSATDSHVELPVVPLSRDRLMTTEIVPFERAMQADAVMVAHIWYPALEPQPDMPASLSKNVIDGVLRQTMGYTGIVVTDAMDMDAIDQHYDYRQAAIMAINAGADMVAMGPAMGLDTQGAMIQAVIDAVHSGEIPEARIHDSAQRILDAKARFGLLDWQPLDPAAASEQIHREAHEALIEDLFQAGVTVAYDHSHLVPVPPQRSVAVVYLATRNYTVPACNAYRSDIHWVGVALHPSPDEIGWAVDAARQVETIVVFTDNAHENPQQQALVQALPQEKTVVVALSSPYDWQHFPFVAAYVLTHSPLPPAIPAACAVLFGAEPARGILPFTLSPDLPAGTRAE